MPVIYISPYYSMLDHSLSLEGLAGFRYFDRYGGSQAVALNSRAYEPSSALAGVASQPYVWSKFMFSEMGASVDWREGASFNLTHVEADEPFVVRHPYAQIDTTNYSASFTPGSAFTAPAADVRLMNWYQNVDSANAQATSSPGWVPGAGMLAGEADSYMWYFGLDGSTARATGVKAFPPIGGAGEANSRMWYFGPDGATARATLSPGWVDGSTLIAADVMKQTRKIAEGEVDASNITQVYPGQIPTTAVAPVKTVNYFDSLSNIQTGGSIANGSWCSMYWNINQSSGISYYEFATYGNALAFGFLTSGYQPASCVYSYAVPLGGKLLSGIGVNVLDADATDYMAHSGTVADSPGDVFGALLDIANRTVRFYRNGVLFASYLNIPTGRSWRPGISFIGNAPTLRFKTSEFTKKPDDVSPTESPGGVYDGTAVGLAQAYLSKIEDETLQNLVAQYLNNPPSSVAVKTISGNVLEDAKLNNGTLTTFGLSNGYWNSSFCPVEIKSGKAYFEVVANLVGNSFTISFTTGDGSPVNNGDFNSGQYGIGTSDGAWPINGNSLTANVNALSYSYYIQADTSWSMGDVLSAMIDIPNQKIRFYINGQLRGEITGIPQNKTYRAAMCAVSDTYIARFNQSSWSMATACGYTVPEGLLGGPVDGQAVGTYIYQMSDDDVDSSAPTLVYQGQVPSTVANVEKVVNAFEGALLNNGQLSGAYSPWTTLYCTKSAVLGGKHYFEVFAKNSSGHLALGFTNEAGLSIIDNAQTPFGGYYLTTTTNRNVTNPEAKVYAFYLNQWASPVGGYVYGVLLDTVARTITWYVNGSIQVSCINIPLDRTWIPSVSICNDAWVTMRFNQASWTRFSGLGVQLATVAPGGPVNGLAADALFFKKNENEVVSTNPVAVYSGLVPSTVVAPQKISNALEGAVLDNGGTAAYAPSDNWHTWLANKSATGGKMYFEVFKNSGTTTGMFGFVTSIGAQAASLNTLGPTGSSLTNSMVAVTNQGATDYAYYPDSYQSWSNGDTFSMLLDIDARTLKFYRNGVFLNGYSNLPSGRTWTPAIVSYQSMYATAKFNISTWTYAEYIGGVPDVGSPGGVVTGYAVDFTRMRVQEDEAANIVLHAAAAEVAWMDGATPRYLVSDDTAWGSSQGVWTAELSNLSSRNPSIDQEAENLIAGARNDVALGDSWISWTPVLVKASNVGTSTVYDMSELSVFLTADLVRLPPPKGLDVVHAEELQACVDLASMTRWDFRNEMMLYPLNVQPTSGLSNTTGFTTEG